MRCTVYTHIFLMITILILRLSVSNYFNFYYILFTYSVHVIFILIFLECTEKHFTKYKSQVNCASFTCHPVLICVSTEYVFPYFHQGHRWSLVVTICVKVLCFPSICGSSMTKTPLKLITQPLYNLFDIFYMSI